MLFQYSFQLRLRIGTTQVTGLAPNGKTQPDQQGGDGLRCCDLKRVHHDEIGLIMVLWNPNLKLLPSELGDTPGMIRKAHRHCRRDLT
jgi:hypothetical protein